jgi:hypothetical protein
VELKLDSSGIIDRECVLAGSSHGELGGMISLQSVFSLDISSGSKAVQGGAVYIYFFFVPKTNEIIVQVGLRELQSLLSAGYVHLPFRRKLASESFEA